MAEPLPTSQPSDQASPEETSKARQAPQPLKRPIEIKTFHTGGIRGTLTRREIYEDVIAHRMGWPEDSEEDLAATETEPEAAPPD